METHTVKFVVVERSDHAEPYPFMVLRLSDERKDTVSYHGTEYEAIEAARHYAVEARFSGLRAVILQEKWPTDAGTPQTRSI